MNRQAIAAALNTVRDVRGTARRPTVLRPGAAWPQWAGAERGSAFTFLRTWRVYVVLPADEAAADLWADEHIDALAAALEPVIFVSEVAPILLNTPEGDMFALMLTGRAE